MTSDFSIFKKKLANSFAFRMFLLSKVPAAFFAGIKLEQLDGNTAAVSVSYNWFNKNPFRSVYFAILSMAGEISTGVICMGYLYRRNPAISVLLINIEGSFIKKATGKVVFTCKDGHQIADAVNEAEATGEATTQRCHAIGKNTLNETVADFYFTWSFKARKKV